MVSQMLLFLHLLPRLSRWRAIVGSADSKADILGALTPELDTRMLAFLNKVVLQATL